MKGILLGLVQGEDEPRIAVKVGGADALTVPVSYALLVYDQLGSLLDAVGAFEDEDEDEGEDEDVVVH